MSEGTVLMTAEEIDRALSRIAHQVLEHCGGAKGLALVGIYTRGVPLARRLAWKIAQAGEEAPPVGILDINLYRDDLSAAGGTPQVRRTELPFKVDGRRIVLVDDVLYTGRTIRSAMDALIDLGRPALIHLAVLIDRGGRELPIQSDFCGRTFTVLPQEVVEVRVAEIDGGPDRVLVRGREEVLAERKKRAEAARAASITARSPRRSKLTAAASKGTVSARRGGKAKTAPAVATKTQPKTKAKTKAAAQAKAKAASSKPAALKTKSKPAAKSSRKGNRR